MQRDRLELLSRLPGWAWDPIAEAWEGGYRRLLAYVEREGTSAVKRDYVEPDGYALGSWAASQRKNRDRLDPDRLERLGKLLGWTWDPFSDAWEEGFNRVLAYLERHGTSAVKRSYIESDGYRLGSWAQTQRVKRDRLDSSRAERLSKLPGWTWNPFDDSWEDGYARIVAYVERHGTAEIKRNYIDPDGFRLGDWVTEQRTQKKNGKLKADREERLVRLSGWVWPKTTVEKWEDGFRRLESFVKQHNSAMMRDDYVEEDGHKLGMWVRNQKSRHSAGRLDPERIKRLEVLKGWSWSTRRR